MNIKRRIFMLLSVAIAIAFTFMIISCSQEDDVIEEAIEESIHIWHHTAFSDIGIVSSANGPVRLIDAISGETIVLCDRPDCRHVFGQAVECLALLEMLHAFIIYNGRQVFIRTKEGEPLTLEVYTADINGHNRRAISEIPKIAEFISRIIVKDGKLVFAYHNRHELDEMGLLQERTSTRTGIVLVDLETGETKTFAEKDNVAADITRLYYKNGFIYFAYSNFNEYYDHDYMMELMWEDVASWSSGEVGTDYAGDYMRAHSVVSVWSVDIETNDETLIWKWEANDNSEQFFTVSGFTNNYAVLQTQGIQSVYLLSLETGSKDASLISVADNEYEWVFSVVNNNELFYGITNRSGQITNIYEYDFETSAAREIILQGLWELNISSVHTDWIFTVGNDNEGEFYYGVLSRDDFLNGIFDNHRIIFFPNRIWE